MLALHDSWSWQLKMIAFHVRLFNGYDRSLVSLGRMSRHDHTVRDQHL